MSFKSNPEGLGRLRHRVFIKKTARHVPLASSSYHPRAVHHSWPVAEMQRMARRCDDRCTGRLFQKQKLDRFAWFLLDPEILELCKAWRAKQGSRSAQLALNSGRAQPSRKTCRLILPFRRELVSLPFQLTALWEQWAAHFIADAGVTLELKLSWFRAGSPLSSLLLW